MRTKRMLNQQSRGVGELEDDLTGDVLILKDTELSVDYQQPKFQLWRAERGFGCLQNTTGRAVFATALVDGEEARWSRQDFIGIASKALVDRVMRPHWLTQMAPAPTKFTW